MDELTRAMQDKLMEMLAYFHNVCETQCLRYFLIGGSMLGAMRHKGFIPWDDDADIGMPRQDYERFIRLTDPSGRYVCGGLHTQETSCAYAKLYDTTTTLVEYGSTNRKRGIFIDIFPLDGIGETQEDAYKNFAPIQRAHDLFTARVVSLHKKRSLMKTAFIIAARCAPFISARKVLIKLDSLCASRDYDTSAYVGNLVGIRRKKEIMPREWFGTPTLYPFGNLNLYGVEKPEEYLTRLYGDWRQLPPEEKRVSEHDFAEINLHQSYLTGEET